MLDIPNIRTRQNTRNDLSKKAIMIPSKQPTLSKKSTAIELWFKEETFSGATDQCFGLTIRGLLIRARKYSLTNQEHSKLIVNCPKGGAFEFYLKEIDPRQKYETAVEKLRARHNTLRRKSSSQFEVESLTSMNFGTSPHMEWEGMSTRPYRIREQRYPTTNWRILNEIKQS